EAWKYANYRHDVALKGLPLHKEEADEQGRFLYLDVPKQLQKELFPTDQVSTQKEEVERVQKKLPGKLASAGDTPKQAALYANILLPLARTNTEREDLLSVRTHLADENAIAKLKGDLQEAFAGAVADNKAAQDKKVEWAFVQRVND